MVSRIIQHNTEFCRRVHIPSTLKIVETRYRSEQYRSAAEFELRLSLQLRVIATIRSIIPAVGAISKVINLRRKAFESFPRCLLSAFEYCDAYSTAVLGKDRT